MSKEITITLLITPDEPISDEELGVIIDESLYTSLGYNDVTVDFINTEIKAVL